MQPDRVTGLYGTELCPVPSNTNSSGAFSNGLFDRSESESRDRRRRRRVGVRRARITRALLGARNKLFYNFCFLFVVVVVKVHDRRPRARHAGRYADI